MNDDELAKKIMKLQGPILVLGASGFIGANLFRALLKRRDDAYGTTHHSPAWRLEGLPEKNVLTVDLLVDANLDKLLEDVKPKTVFDCVAYGAYSFETESPLIYQTNFLLTAKLLSRLEARRISRYIHAGSSSEYGDNAAAPREDAPSEPNSDYAVSKAAAANLIRYHGKKKGLPCANLRLYSVYGPLEDSSRLIPTLVRRGLEGGYPDLVDPEISRDFVYVDDASESFIDAALNLKEEDYGGSFNVGSGLKTTIRDVAAAAKDVFSLSAEPSFRSMARRGWDVADWYASTEKTEKRLGWKASTSLRDGLKATSEWYQGLESKERYLQASKQYGLDKVFSVTAVIACYKDNLAIPIMHQRLKATFEKLKIDYEIVFVNDNSPDDSEEVIRAISRGDRRVVGISHSRNFGSQSAFRSGMELSTKNACVLLDGDLQDPPELIEQFVEKWREGYDVVYGRRGRREGTLFMRLAAKAFYRVFDYFSYIRIPHDAGDFSLLDRRVVQWVLRCPERDFFLRGVRSFVGFKQTGVDYYRPARMFGTSTNDLLKNIGWAKKGILSFSNTPLNILSSTGVFLFLLTIVLAAAQTALRILYPALSPHGITTVLLAILFFGSMNLLGIAVIGEYIAKIFEEVKRRPHFIRRSIIKDGDVRFAADPAGTDAG
jgi:nucleoside-diphosphate-sugar epimerase/glycosyltransferase involved in cell wall biosynthesis